MKKSFFLIGAALLVAMAIILASCAPKPAQPSTSATTSAAAKKIRIGVSYMTLSNPFFVSINDAIKAGTDKGGIELIVADSQYDVAKQVKDVENFISMGVNAIILNPVDSQGVVTAVQKANDAKIPVLAIDTTAASGDIACHIASDNYQAGKVGAEFIAKQLNGKGAVCLIDNQTIDVGIQREKGVMDVFNQYPGIKVLGSQKGGSESDALKIGEVWVQRFPDLDAVWGINDQNAMGALTAYEQAGHSKLFVVGIDGIQESFDAMKDGRKFLATAAQQPDIIGKDAIENAVKIINGEKVDKEVQVPVKLITKDNIPL